MDGHGKEAGHGHSCGGDGGGHSCGRGYGHGTDDNQPGK